MPLGLPGSNWGLQDKTLQSVQFVFSHSLDLWFQLLRKLAHKGRFLCMMKPCLETLGWSWKLSKQADLEINGPSPADKQGLTQSGVRCVNTRQLPPAVRFKCNHCDHRVVTKCQLESRMMYTFRHETCYFHEFLLRFCLTLLLAIPVH